MKFRIFALVIGLAFLSSYSYAAHQHQIKHSHEIWVGTFFLKDGTPLTSGDKYDVISGKLEGIDILHTHKVDHALIENPGIIVPQSIYDGYFSNLETLFDSVEEYLDLSSNLRSLVVGKRDTILISGQAFGIGTVPLQELKDSVDEVAVTIDSHDAFLQEGISNSLQALIDREGHEDHMQIARVSQNHTFHYDGQSGREKLKKGWAVISIDETPMAPRKPSVSKMKTGKGKRKLTMTWASLKKLNR